MLRRFLKIGSVLVLAGVSAAAAQGVRDFTRSKTSTPATVTEAQAAEVTLTLTDVQMRPIQTWVRAAGEVNAAGDRLTIRVKGAQASLLQPGQRLRAFSVNSRAQMQQGRVSSVTRSADGATAIAELASPLFGNPSRSIVEIVTEAGPYLSIPNVSIIEEEGARLVYVRQPDGGYLQRAIQTGIQGELYTQVLDGLNENDEVVSVGSFFVDADAKLQATGGMGAMAGMDHSGMDHSAMGHGGQGATADPTGPLRLSMSDPANGASGRAPMMVHVIFSKPVDPAKSRIEIVGPSGRVSAGPPSLMGSDATVLMVTPDKPLPAGDYRVSWKAEARSNETASGEFTFSVR